MAKKGKGKGKGVPKHIAVPVSTNAFQAPFVVAAEEKSASVTQIGIEACDLANAYWTARFQTGSSIVDRFESSLKDIYSSFCFGVTTLEGKTTLPDM